jgi:hypothetical protein
MSERPATQTAFVTLVRNAREKACMNLLVESIRSFGGALSSCEIWVFDANPQTAYSTRIEREGIQVLPLSPPDTTMRYYFADKVYACAQAEYMAAGRADSLVWIDPACLIVKPPLLFELGRWFDVGVRPVHIRNVGLGATEPLDGFWERTYEAVGVQDVEATVESFVDGQMIRAYYNSHAFAVDPSLGLLRQWKTCFEGLVLDQGFQEGSCADDHHQIFLHQAVLSALIATTVEPTRIRVFPPDYNYPYNLHTSVPIDKRASTLNEVVCITYEERSLDPKAVDDIAIDEPLRSWLAHRMHLDGSPENSQ